MSTAARSAVLILGATGFIGERLRRSLQQAGHDVVCGVRAGHAPRDGRSVEIDFAVDTKPDAWVSRLAGFDVVVNAIGILRETGSASFETIHVDAPAAVFRACVEAGVRKVLQISALGADAHAVSRYHISKKRGDDVLAALPLEWVIVQPSLVFGIGGASAALFTLLAALPLMPLPGEGDQRLQPIHIDDFASAIVNLVASSEHDRQRIAAVGPRPLTLREYLAALRRALGLGKPRFIQVPMALVRTAAAVGDHVRGVLLDRESLGMLLRGNVASSETITAVLGRPPRPAESFIPKDYAPAIANDARLAWLLPLLRATIAIVWIVTAIVSLGVFPIGDSYALLARVGLTGVAATFALYGAAVIDLAFGLGIFILHERRWLWRAQFALILGYSVIIAIKLPEYWVHPFGPLLKNLPMLAAILMLHELEPARHREKK